MDHVPPGATAIHPSDVPIHLDALLRWSNQSKGEHNVNCGQERSGGSEDATSNRQEMNGKI